MIKKLFVLILIIALGYNAHCEEVPTIILVRKSNGLLTLKVSLKETGTIKVDWGNNNIKTYDINATSRLDEATIVSEEVKRNVEIKVYGKGITLFSCIDQFVTFLDVKQAVALTNLNCAKNYIKQLDLSKNKNLKAFNGYDNRFREMDFSNNIKITSLTCSYNYLRKISLEKNTALQHLNISDNHIKTLSLLGNISLKHLNVNGNKLSDVNVAHLKRLQFLDLSYNNFSSCEFNTVFSALPSLENNEKKNLMITFNKGARKSNTRTAENKNWKLDVLGNGSAKCD